jgi:hypothetical protein
LVGTGCSADPGDAPMIERLSPLVGRNQKNLALDTVGEIVWRTTGIPVHADTWKSSAVKVLGTIPVRRHGRIDRSPIMSPEHGSAARNHFKRLGNNCSEIRRPESIHVSRVERTTRVEH